MLFGWMLFDCQSALRAGSEEEALAEIAPSVIMMSWGGEGVVSPVHIRRVRVNGEFSDSACRNLTPF
jgi:hypothetical protein